MMRQKESPEEMDPLDESMDNMESLILNPPEFDSVAESGYSTGASQSFFSHTEEDDPLGIESDFAPYSGYGHASDHSMEPPSYTDALHAPRVSAASSASPSSSRAAAASDLSGATGAAAEGVGVSSGAAQGGSFLTVRVADPQKHPDSSSSSMLPGGGTYVSYAVTTHTNFPDFGGTGRFKVRRRFKEFVALADRLAETHRGYFIPARPDKSVVENQLMAGKDFVEMRRVELEKYLHRLAKHPIISRSRELIMFLTTEGKLPLFPKADVASRMLEGVVKLPGQLLMGGPNTSSVPAPSEAVQPASGGRDLLRIFKEFGQSVANDWVGSGPAASGHVGVVDPEEEEFNLRKHRLEELEKHLSEASIQAENLVRAQADLTRVTGNLGLSFLALCKLQQRTTAEPLLNSATAQQQEVHREMGEVCRLGGSALVKESRLHQQAVSESISQLAQFHEYLKGLQAAKSAFADRSQALVTVQTLTADVASKKAKQERLNSSGPRPGDISRVKRGIEIEEELDKALKSKAAAEGELERIKERNMVEFDRFDAERRQDMCSMLESFTRIQALASERTAQLWENSYDGKASKGKREAPV